MKRLYEAVIAKHFREDRQMLLLSGPRQVGKTTTARTTAAALGEYRYYSWDDDDDRLKIIGGPSRIAADMSLHHLRRDPPLALFDEIHHYRHWRTFLKGLFDAHPGEVRVLVTGSARLDVLRRGGRGLMGRYLPYRMHPLSLAELTSPEPREEGLVGPPRSSDPGVLDTLIRFGGFPEPLTRQSERFSRRWSRLRMGQLIREDLRDLTRVQEVGQVRVLAELLRRSVGRNVSLASLSREVKATITTVSRWIEALSALYYCFPVRPYFKNVPRALRKEPKFYLFVERDCFDLRQPAVVPAATLLSQLV